MVQIKLKQPNRLIKNKVLYFCTIYFYSKNVVIRHKAIFILNLLKILRSKYHSKINLMIIFINILEFNYKSNFKAITQLIRKPIYVSNITKNWSRLRLCHNSCKGQQIRCIQPPKP